MVNLPSVRHLRHLLALYECGHFGRAAEACRVTQSTLSASIKELEALLEATLVDRTKRRVVLTPVGIETVERARSIIKDIEDLVSFTASAREPLSSNASCPIRAAACGSVRKRDVVVLLSASAMGHVRGLGLGRPGR